MSETFKQCSQEQDELRARIERVEAALREIAAMAHNKDIGRYALQVGIEAAVDAALTHKGE